ncbi:MAG: hypothetical protein E6I08_06740 [Chloroflexi bacterium]|nr:MAG: hypothetical protein E6I08_06740 [Chloroflexota bacterium]
MPATGSPLPTWPASTRSWKSSPAGLPAFRCWPRRRAAIAPEPCGRSTRSTAPAERGRGARRNGQPLPVAPLTEPASAVVATGFPFRRKQLAARYLPVFAGALERFEDLRRAGAAALDLAWTGAGVFDGFFELELNTWDVAAGGLIVLETGGRVSDWSGDERAWLGGGDILAGSPAVHSALLELAAEAPEG